MADTGMLKTSGSELECFADFDFSLVEWREAEAFSSSMGWESICAQ